MKTLMKYFVSGLLFLVPVGVTCYVIYWIYSGIDSLVRGGREDKLPWWATILVVVVSLAVITLVGVLASSFVTRRLFQLVEKIFGRLPLIKLMYSSIKDLVGAFVGDKKKFDKPVLVTLTPGGNLKALGFVTRQSLDFLGLEGEVAVYLPQSYNFAGELLVVPRNQVTPVKIDSSELMAFVVSGGVSGAPPQRNEQ